MTPQNAAGGAARLNGYVLAAYALAALAMLLWAGNWVLGRAVRAEIPPVGLNFWRWTFATIVVLPFAWAPARRDWPVVRRHWKLMLTLGATGAAVSHSMIYIGLRSTEAINALLLNSAAPIIIVVMAWAVFGDRVSPRQIVGIAISLVGTVVLVARGELANLARLSFNEGDLWVLGALTSVGLYTILLKRRPPGLGGLSLIFYMCVTGVLVMAPLYAWETLDGRPVSFTVPTLASIAYTGIFASVVAFLCYNAAIARVGPNLTSFFIHLMPVFGSALAIAFLGETLRLYHGLGFAVVLTGILLSTVRVNGAAAPRPS